MMDCILFLFWTDHRILVEGICVIWVAIVFATEILIYFDPRCRQDIVFMSFPFAIVWWDTVMFNVFDYDWDDIGSKTWFLSIVLCSCLPDFHLFQFDIIFVHICVPSLPRVFEFMLWFIFEQTLISLLNAGSDYSWMLR